jgi:hypothetical protein
MSDSRNVRFTRSPDLPDRHTGSGKLSPVNTPPRARITRPRNPGRRDQLDTRPGRVTRNQRADDPPGHNRP